MSSPAPLGNWNAHGHGVAVQTPPPSSIGNECGEDGITVKPMRLKVLYTFDDQNKTNCLARWPNVLQIQTVTMEEGAIIGVIELKTCIQAIVQCSPELVARMGQDYTVYAYDYSEYDNPLVGQGMLSRVLHAASPAPEAPAQQSRQLITGRVCKNILGLFSNGVKETLEVKLRLVPVPTAVQNEYQSTMEKFRETSRNVPPPGYDMNEWNALVQSAPNFGRVLVSSVQGPSRPGPGLNQRDGVSMEVVNQLLSPSVHESQAVDMFDGQPMDSFTSHADQSFNAPTPPPLAPPPVSTAPKTATSRPNSRNTTKRPRKARNTPAAGGNTSGYEEGTEGEETQPARKKRAKITKANEWNAKSSFGTGADLRMAASTAGSLRLFRPIAMSPVVPGSHLQEVPRAPTPIPKTRLQEQKHARSKSALRGDSFTRESSLPSSPYVPPMQIEDDLRSTIESAGPSPERQDTPADTPPEVFGSSPPVMRTRPPTPNTMRSSPPCPTSPCLPQMPRLDSGFMSGTIEELFGDDDNGEQEEVEAKPQKRGRGRGNKASKPAKAPPRIATPTPFDNTPVDLPQKSKNVKPGTSVFSINPTASRSGSVVSEDGSQTLPVLKPSRTSKAKSHLSVSVEQAQILPKPSPQLIAPYHPPMPEPQRQIAPMMPVAPMTAQNPNMEMDTPQIPFSQILPPPVSVMSRPEDQAPLPPPPPPPPPVEVQQPIESVTINEKVAEPSPLPEPAPVEQPVLSPTPMSLVEPSSVTDSTPSDLQTQRRPSMPAPTLLPQPSRRMFGRTASAGALSLPQIPASDPVLPPSQLRRAETWSEVPHPVSEAHYPSVDAPSGPFTNAGNARSSQGPSKPSTENEIPYSRTANAKKAAIKQKLEAAIANGEMPPYCRNCGAIETPAWRKAWAQECQGAPAYYEYSDEPGRVTAIMVLTRDEYGNPTSYLLIKKSLKTTENMSLFQEFVLCNPCGIWMSKYKTQRPPERWESNKSQPEKKAPEAAVRPQYYRPPPMKQPKIGGKNSEPPVVFDSQYTYGPSPTDTTIMIQQETATQQERERSEGAQKRLNAMTSDAASAALKRALQSSPARWNGSRHSPIDIDVEEVDTTRRLLFPSPRKDGSPKVLGETTTNIVQISPVAHKSVMLDAPNKENCPPVIDRDNNDDEFIKFFEADIARPTTPIQKEVQPNPFKTPTRPTPSHRPITRSVSKSARRSPSNFLAVTPSRITPRRSPRNHTGGFVSPFTATLNQMMSEASNHVQTSPSRHAHMSFDMDMSTLPDLPISGRHGHLENTFSLEDFFSTDVPMPSSPPRSFRMYEDPSPIDGGFEVDASGIDWNEFQDYSGSGLGTGVGIDVHVHVEEVDTITEKELVIKAEPETSPVKSNLEEDKNV